MTVNLTNAVHAYDKMLRQSGSAGLEARDVKGGGFSEALQEAAKTTVESLREAESKSLEAAVGRADLNDVVLAVSSAELTLETVVSVRDRVIQAYQDILRMPI
ncbi:MAG: flagellar hook-basal body complex protein FliE [Pseudomonadota bacterium]